MVERAKFTIVRAQRYAVQRVVNDAFEPPRPEELRDFLDAEEPLRTVIQIEDPLLFTRATRDALSQWLDERAHQIGGSTSRTPPGWPYETWPA
jgi:hypothetical protein